MTKQPPLSPKAIINRAGEVLVCKDGSFANLCEWLSYMTLLHSEPYATYTHYKGGTLKKVSNLSIYQAKTKLVPSNFNWVSVDKLHTSNCKRHPEIVYELMKHLDLIDNIKFKEITSVRYLVRSGEKFAFVSKKGCKVLKLPGHYISKHQPLILPEGAVSLGKGIIYRKSSVGVNKIKVMVYETELSDTLHDGKIKWIERNDITTKRNLMYDTPFALSLA